MTSQHATPVRHRWKFFRTGGLEQVALESAADLLALNELDQKLWVALSCPIAGLELDEKTLALIDTDGDGRIHVREVIAAVQWAASQLKQPADLLSPQGALPIAAINDQTPQGRTILASARRILENVGKGQSDAISVEDTTDLAKIITARAPNGDGVITLRAGTDPETRALIKDILATMGSAPDRGGGAGITAEKAAAFFKELETYLKWIDATTEKNLPELGSATGAACAALQAVHAKVDDYFGRCRLAAFDPRAVAALNRQESEYLTIAARNLTLTAEEIGDFPLARIAPAAPLPLLSGVNPAWAQALATLHKDLVAPLLGAEKTLLTEEDWGTITARLAPYETWLGSKAATPVEKLGAARAREIMQSPGRARLAELLALDEALAPEYNAISDVARLSRYYRDLRTLLHNFVNFADFYSRDRIGVFQAGLLYLDSRSCELCLRVFDVNAHATLAAMSKTYLVYLDCQRAGGETMKIAACFTQGDSDYLFVGRHGLFYDRKGRDWDATITKIIDNPISIRQAFWSPYKKFLRMIEEQVAKRAAAADAATSGRLQDTATAAVAASAPGAAIPAPPKKFDVGTIAALGVGLGAIATAFGIIFGKFVELPVWQIPFVIVGIILAISLPSMVIAWLKIRQRTLGPLLEANGWAVNGRVKINVAFGNALTGLAALPPGANRTLKDPYLDESAHRRRTLLALLVIFGLLAGAVWLRMDRLRRGHYFWQPVPAPAAAPASSAPVAPKS
ncbi:MAG: hypothetical protein RIQ93_321 [Verrucomicrobiota bacterium]|jgi:hypothetical protein